MLPIADMGAEMCMASSTARKTDSCQRGGVWGAGWKKAKGLTKKQEYITRGRRQQCGAGQREWGWG